MLPVIGRNDDFWDRICGLVSKIGKECQSYWYWLSLSDAGYCRLLWLDLLALLGLAGLELRLQNNERSHYHCVISNKID